MLTFYLCIIMIAILAGVPGFVLAKNELRTLFYEGIDEINAARLLFGLILCGIAFACFVSVFGAICDVFANSNNIIEALMNI